MYSPNSNRCRFSSNLKVILGLSAGALVLVAQIMVGGYREVPQVETENAIKISGGETDLGMTVKGDILESEKLFESLRDTVGQSIIEKVPRD